jgi:hypothetical protein
MCCNKKKHLSAMWIVLPMVAVITGGMVLYLKKTKSGRRMAKKARRIGKEVEDMITSELGF